MTQRNTLLLFVSASIIVCAFDIFSALHGHGGRAAVAWTLAAVMAVIAAIALRKLLTLR